ncbi:MAG: bis(5'-nucleosyl)-tetraphosphatase (symmetrical) YqeK, partial [Tissierellia bacterium]|nr:bis(5'-nucleosyl)-tetraphosphatase (symmetrical) YqeK [Tissierellia bacterium]
MNDLNIEEIKLKLKNSVSSKIYEHCLRTMDESIKLAIKYDEDINKAKIAGLLHDCGKLINKNVGNLEHSILGAELAKNNYLIEDVDILNAIRYHTTGREAMTMLEKIVFIADKIEPNRSYPGVEEMRLLAYDNIDKAIIKSLRSTI